jgi:hypothetical protein
MMCATILALTCTAIGFLAGLLTGMWAADCDCDDDPGPVPLDYGDAVKRCRRRIPGQRRGE